MKFPAVNAQNMKKMKFIAVLLLPVLLFAVVKLLLHSNIETVCIWRLLTGKECPGCGITRAFNALFSLDFKAAFNFNHKIVIVAPLMLFLWLKLCFDSFWDCFCGKSP